MLNALLLTAGIEVYIFLIQFAFFILQIVSFWMLFQKADVAGWKSIIPIYSNWKMFDIVWKTKYFWFTLGLSVVYAVLMYLVQNVITTGVFFIVLTVVRLIVLFFSCMLEFFFYRHLARSYGKGDCFVFGLFFLYPIFILILGLGRSRFVGKK